MRNILLLLTAIILVSCSETDRAKSRIKKDLDSRFTGFEIVEVKPYNSNIELVTNKYRALRIKVAESNNNIIKLIEVADNIKNKEKLKEYYFQINLIDSTMKQSLEIFERLEYVNPERCFYVKYLVYKDEKKIPVEEYFLIKDNEVLHRPLSWKDYMYELGYDELLDDAFR